MPRPGKRKYIGRRRKNTAKPESNLLQTSSIPTVCPESHNVPEVNYDESKGTSTTRPRNEALENSSSVAGGMPISSTPSPIPESQIPTEQLIVCEQLDNALGTMSTDNYMGKSAYMEDKLVISKYTDCNFEKDRSSETTRADRSTEAITGYNDLPLSDHSFEFSESIGIPVSIDQSAIDNESMTAVTSDETLIAHLRSTATKKSLEQSLGHDWIVKQVCDGLQVFQMTEFKNINVEKSIFVNNVGQIQVFIHGIELLQSHVLLTDIFELTHTSTVSDITNLITNFISKLSTFKICCGNYESTYRYLWEENDSRYSYCGIKETKYSTNTIFRVHDCCLLSVLSLCQNCSKFRKKLRNQHFRENKIQTTTDTIKPTRPHETMTKDQLKSTLKTYAENIHKLSKKVTYRDNKIKKMIQKDAIRLSNEIDTDLQGCIRGNESNMTEIQKLFWQQQLKLSNVKGKKGMRWHPMMIRLALRIKMLSNTAFGAIQESGIIKFPSQRTLFDYTNYMEATEGCQGTVLAELKNTIDSLNIPTERRYFALMFDEMNIKHNLVFKAHSGEFIGYVKLNDVESEFAAIEKLTEGQNAAPPVLAKKVLVYMINGLACKIRDVVAVYSTVDVTAAQIFNRTWDVVYRLELIDVKVLCLICDGAGPNRKFFQMHNPITPGKLCFDTINVRSGDFRPIFFISDPPHLIKTLRNCFSNSYAHRRSRKLWNKKGDISWHLIERLYESTKSKTLRMASKLTANHVYLNSFSCMKVNLAAQVLSETVAAALEQSEACNKGNTDPSATVEFIRMCNKFFDCLNGCHTKQGREKRNPNLNAYTDINDERFAWLVDTFLAYFDDWEMEVRQRSAQQFSDADRSRMKISRQTIDGLYITIHGFIGVTRFLLKNGVKYINARVLNQDQLEQYFGKHRRSCGTNNNPNLGQFLQNTVSLRLQGKLARASKRGNTETKGKGGINIDDEPLPKRRK